MTGGDQGLQSDKAPVLGRCGGERVVVERSRRDLDRMAGLSAIIVVCCAQEAMSMQLPVPRASFITMQLLGPDGLPLSSGADSCSSGGGPGAGLILDGGGSSMSGSSGLIGLESGGGSEPGPGNMPADLADFDPSFDPLAAKRPKYDFCGASGRDGEMVWGAVGPESEDDIDEWCAHMIKAGVVRVLGLFTEAEAAARGPDGTAAGYMGALVAAGFDPTGVALLDPRAEGSRSFVLEQMRDSFASKKKLCIHCADGRSLTAVVMADWLLTDYIGGTNYLEACDLLAARKRLAGVERRTTPEALEEWITEGKVLSYQ